MRIISGSAGGRKLFTPQNNDIRPTADRAREALFSILSKLCKNAIVIDFFAGTGALGLEALSRGADRAYFVDSAKEALETTAKNVTMVEKSLVATEIKLIHHDLTQGLPLRQLNQLKINQADLILADPPYSKGLGLVTLERIEKAGLLAPLGAVVIEERFNVDLPEKVGELALEQRRKYGEAAFWIYRHKDFFTSIDDNV